MLLGDMGVGKTSILYRLVHDRFDGQYKTTLGVEVLSYDVPGNPAGGGEPTRLVLWDTDGDFGTRILKPFTLRELRPRSSYRTLRGRKRSRGWWSWLAASKPNFRKAL
ncbi:hypothetical protein [Sinorhizobium psoraleae]